MTHTKILIGQIVLSLLLVLAAIWGATQWAAHALGYQAALGAPWFFSDGLPVYKPWRLFQWWYAYEAYAPEVFSQAGLIAASGGFMATLAAIAGSVLRARHSKFVTTYGSARWAKPVDVQKAGLQIRSGVMLGLDRNRYLRHDGPEHVLAFAPTRSGKGVGLVVPTLLEWRGGAIIHDIKGENWSLTSRWRSTFTRCIRFDPTDMTTPRFNPLMEVRRGEHEVRDVQNIADILVDPEGSLERRNHWDRTAHALLTGSILHVLYAEEDKTLAGVARLLSDPARSSEDVLQAMLATNHVGTNAAPDAHPVVAQVARELLNKSDNERSGVLSTAMSFLSLYRDPVIARATGASDWRIEDLVDPERPVSLYLVVPPSDISRTKPLIRLILNQVGRRLTEALPAQDAKRTPLLMMLDEFPALGRLDFFETTLAFMAGYGVRAFLIAQSLNQIDKAYGVNNSILDNCHVRVTFATNDERTAKRISDALGTATEQRAQRNYAGHRLAPWLSHVMVSRQETSRPLMTPGEVMQLPASSEIVMVSGAPPVKAQKLRYYMDANFTTRVGEAENSERADSEAPSSSEWNGCVPDICEDLVPDDGPERSRRASSGDREIQRTVSDANDASRTAEPDNDASVSDDADDNSGDETIDPSALRRAFGLDLADDDTLPGL